MLPTLDPLESRVALSVAPAPVVLGPNTSPIVATTDPQGNVIVVGSYTGVVDFNPRRHRTTAFDAAADGSLFVAKYSPAGELFWATPYYHSSDVLSGTGPEVSTLATDRDGGIFIVGRMNGAYDFDPGHRRRILDNQPAETEDRDAFVWKLNADGSYAYATIVQPSGVDAVSDVLKIAVAADGSTYVAGDKANALGEPAGAVNFLAKVSANGQADWSTQLDPYSSPADVAIDPARQTAVVLTRDGLRGIAVSHFSAAGRVEQRVRVAVSPSFDGLYPTALAVDARGDLFVSGTVSANGQADFDPDPGIALVRESGATSAGFLAKYTADHRPVFAHLLRARVQDVAIDPATGDVVAAGQFQNAVDLDPSAQGSFVLDTGDTYTGNGGQTDLYAARYSAGGRFRSASHLGVARAFDDFIGLGVTPDHRPAVVAATVQTRAPRDRVTTVFRT